MSGERRTEKCNGGGGAAGVVIVVVLEGSG